MNKACFRKLLLVVVLAIGTATESMSQNLNSNDNLCSSSGYMVGFFNGVWNDSADAERALRAIRSRTLGKTFNEENIEYEVFYNQTGGSNAGSTFLQDLAEVFIQREVELRGALEGRWEFFWEAVQASSAEDGFLSRLTHKVGMVSSSFHDLMTAFYHEIVALDAAVYARLFSNPPTDYDYNAHLTRLIALGIKGKKQLLVAHSQGNLFVNQAFDGALQHIPAGSIKVVHIAPASTSLRGTHSLADLDLVINGLRIQGLSTVPPITFALPISHLTDDDPSGHTLIDTYLNPRRDGLPEIQTKMFLAATDLVAPPIRANDGFFTVTLTWNSSGDVDLHTFEPSGSHVYYSSRTGQSGYLDFDNTYGFGPEHYYASCSREKLMTGVYAVGLNNYARASGAIATVQVASSIEGEIYSRTISVGPERGYAGDQNPLYVLSVKVEESPEGDYKVSVQ